MREYKSSFEKMFGENSESTIIDLEELTKFVVFPDQLTGKTILDIGSGVSTATAELTQQGAQAHAIDMRYANKKALHNTSEEYIHNLPQFLNQGIQLPPEQEELLRDHIQRFPDIKKRFMDDLNHPQGKYIAGLAGGLPFRDNTFDFIYSVRCLNYFALHEELFVRGISEALRVLKPGGELQISPFVPERMSHRESENVRKIETIQKYQGHRVTAYQYPYAPYVILSITKGAEAA